jgi:hypothetical protein
LSSVAAGDREGIKRLLEEGMAVVIAEKDEEAEEETESQFQALGLI